ncbi:ribonuclease HII [Rhodothermus bifroesti]|jgi:ribonuclease HII|uniref:Ribonuclease HII n=1 Tax=Rhodothermus marinus TaxID=29549 RepID=A0A7V2B1N7_RHOMR|nr:ribonuclease HII [Rhodothermus bifroesti]GBD01502.1 Ribonuclease HII [bacterium HR18]
MSDPWPEARLWAQGYRYVAGIDEVGRGCLAGPVLAAAVILPPYFQLKGLRDSKQLSPQARQVLSQKIRAQALAIGIGLCLPEEIDRLNILQASLEAMRRAVATLPLQPDYLLIDGNRCFPEPPCPAEPLVQGDRRSPLIAAASILAKTTRDALMRELHRDFPCYGWDRNVGYPTREHYEALARHGPSPHHRRSFRLER